MSVAIGLYIYVVIGMVIATALDRYWMRAPIPYEWAPAWPLKQLRAAAITFLTVAWPVIAYGTVKAIVVRLWIFAKVVRRARRILGRSS